MNSFLGLLQPFSDALKLIVKETVLPSQANKVLFVLAPVSTLIFSLLGWGIIPFGQGLALFDYPLGVFYTLALSSLGVYGVLFAGLINSPLIMKLISQNLGEFQGQL